MQEKTMAIKESHVDRIFGIANSTVLTIIAFTMILPFIMVALMSITPPSEIMNKRILPSKITFDYYKYIIRADSPIVKSFFFTIGRTLIGTFLNLLMTILTAYPLSKMHLPGMKISMKLFVFTMLFQGGMIPTYLIVNWLGLTNSFFALILPSVLIVYYLIIMRTFFRQLPQELEESAKIDGASELLILFGIVIPLSKPVIASLGLFYSVWHWNSFMDSVLYISDRNLWPLQLWLREILINMGVAELASGDALAEVVPPPTALIASTVMIVTVPIIMVYPFMQKYFVKGILIGSVKG